MCPTHSWKPDRTERRNGAALPRQWGHPGIARQRTTQESWSVRDQARVRSVKEPSACRLVRGEPRHVLQAMPSSETGHEASARAALAAAPSREWGRTRSRKTTSVQNVLDEAGPRENRCRSRCNHRTEITGGLAEARLTARATGAVRNTWVGGGGATSGIIA